MSIKSKNFAYMNVLEHMYARFSEIVNLGKSRQTSEVAKRAAFCVAVRKLNLFTLAEIGRHMNKNHATVLHLLAKANDGFYSMIPDYNSSLVVMDNIIESVSDYIKAAKDATLIKIKSEDLKMGYQALDMKISSLEKELEIANKEVLKLQKVCFLSAERLGKIERASNMVNSRLRAFGYEPLDIDYIEDTKEILRDATKRTKRTPSTAKAEV